MLVFIEKQINFKYSASLKHLNFNRITTVVIAPISIGAVTVVPRLFEAFTQLLHNISAVFLSIIGLIFKSPKDILML